MLDLTQNSTDLKPKIISPAVDSNTDICEHKNPSIVVVAQRWRANIMYRVFGLAAIGLAVLVEPAFAEIEAPAPGPVAVCLHLLLSVVHIGSGASCLPARNRHSRRDLIAASLAV
jgi:hypothetical protein